jgi:hypothetical protein
MDPYGFFELARVECEQRRAAGLPPPESGFGDLVGLLRRFLGLFEPSLPAGRRRPMPGAAERS